MIVWLYEWGGERPTSDHFITGAVVDSPETAFELLKRESKQIEWQKRNDWQLNKEWWLGQKKNSELFFYRLVPFEVLTLNKDVG